LFEDLGLNLSSAVDIFLRQALRQGKIPFEIYDPFCSEENQAELRRRINEVETGKKLTVHELIEAGDE
jgi:DNA-damage-inducible protein J